MQSDEQPKNESPDQTDQSVGEPPTSAGDGRRRDGKFARGNRLGRGNPNNKRAQKIRQALLKSIDPQRIKSAIEAQLVAAEQGDRQALELLLDRSIGKVAADSLLIERIEKLEQLAAQQQRTNGMNGAHR